MNTAHPALFIIFPSCPCTQYYIQGPFFFGINYETQPMQSTCFLISSQSYWICLLRREGCWVRLGLWSGTSSTFHLVRWTDAGIDWSCSGSLESLTLAHRKLFFFNICSFPGTVSTFSLFALFGYDCSAVVKTLSSWVFFIFVSWILSHHKDFKWAYYFQYWLTTISSGAATWIFDIFCDIWTKVKRSEIVF